MQRRCELFRHDGANGAGGQTTAPEKSGTYFTCGEFSCLASSIQAPYRHAFAGPHIASIGDTIGYTLEVAASFSGVAFLIYSSFRVAPGLLYVAHAASHWHFFQRLGNKYINLFKCVLSVAYSCMPPQDTLIAVRTYDLAFFYNESS
jgi:hypothetical protein